MVRGTSLFAFWCLLCCATNAVDVPTVKISSGVEMPMIAFGTAKTSFGTKCTVQEAVEQWLRLGGRHIDTADDYGTQPDVGLALKASNVPRKDIFITTKIPGPIGKQAAMDKILHTALPQLGVDYLDLVLIHFPCVGMDQKDAPGCGAEAEAERKDTWAGLDELRKLGKIKAIGVSNYNDQHVGEIISAFKQAPAVNQVQFHLAYHNETLLQSMRSAGTVLEAWASLGGPTVHGREPTISLGDARLKDVAARYNASTAQVALRWETLKGVVPITATCSADHALGDMRSFDLRLTDADMKYLDNLMPADTITV